MSSPPRTFQDTETVVFSLEMAHTEDFHAKHNQKSHAGGRGGSADAAGESRGGTNIPSGPGTPDSTLEILFTNKRRDKNGNLIEQGKVQHGNGTLSVEGLNEDGSFEVFDAKTEAKIAQRWSDLGVTHEQLTANLMHTAEVAMGYDAKTGQFDPSKLSEALEISTWYTEQGGRLKTLSDDTGVPLDNLAAAATVLSAGRLWDGVANGNYETAERLVNIMQSDESISMSQGEIDFMAWREGKATKSTSKIGLDFDHKPGTFKPSDLDSAQLTETLYAKSAMRGYDNFADWSSDSQMGTKTPRNHTGKDAAGNPFPLFTSKGTNQVQQAVSVLRGEVNAREAIAGPKYSSFFSNLRRPDLDYSSTNDTWHYRAMAGNLKMNPLVKKDKSGIGTIREQTVKDYLNPKFKAVLTAQDQFQSGAASKGANLKGGDGMFRDSTAITRSALDQLKTRHPTQFKNMKLHEVQALVWVYYGGGVKSDSTRQSNWDNALSTLPEV